MRREGRAIRISIIAGRTVQIVSICWESKMYLFVNLVVTVATIMYRTRVLIKNTTIKAWSWKWVSSSMTGEAAS